MKEIEIAVEAARAAGEALLGFFGKPIKVERKAGDEPVTIADREANALIVARLRAAFPDDAILSEELPDDGSRHGAHRVWMVDPMDGTKEFLRGDSGFSVMIGLCEDGRPAVGVVLAPTAGRLYTAARGDGAFVKEAGSAAPRRLHVSAIAELRAARMVSSRSHRGSITERIRDALGVADDLACGSVGLKLGLIAEGVRDVYVNPSGRSSLWDACAPDVVLTEAGGRLTDARGGPIDYLGELANRHGLLATNGLLHDLAIPRLGPLLPAA